MSGRSHLKRLNLSHDDLILSREDKQAVPVKPLRSKKLHRPDIKSRLKANRAQFRKGRNNPWVKVVPFTCNACHVKYMSRAAYDRHMNGSDHRAKLSESVACLKQAVSDAINDQVQRGDGNSALFAELMTTVLSKTQVAAIEPVTCALAADIPAPTSLARPSSKPQLLHTQASEVQAQVETEDLSRKTKTELAVDAEILAAPTSMDGPSYEAQFLQTQVSEIKARVEMENASSETKTGLVAAEILAPTFIAGPSCEPQLLPTQGSEIKTYVEVENPSGETKAELATSMCRSS